MSSIKKPRVTGSMRGDARPASARRSDAAVLRLRWQNGVRFIGAKPGERQRREFLRDLLNAQAALRIVPFVRPVQHSQEPVRGDLNVEVRAELAVLHPSRKICCQQR